MKHFFGDLFNCVKLKKGYFIILVLLSIIMIVLGIVAIINLDSDLSIDLSNISYIKFLKGGGFGSMMFGLFLAISIFAIALILCHWKTFLMPIGVIFYLYLVYSQTFVFVSIILIYGIFNCIILLILLLLYQFFLWSIFLLLCCELSCHTKSHYYFKSCFSFKRSKVLFFLLSLLILTLIFTIILTILKKFVILLVFN